MGLCQLATVKQKEQGANCHKLEYIQLFHEVGNLVLRQIVLHFPPKFRFSLSLRAEGQNPTPRLSYYQ